MTLAESLNIFIHLNIRLSYTPLHTFWIVKHACDLNLVFFGDKEYSGKRFLERLFFRVGFGLFSLGLEYEFLDIGFILPFYFKIFLYFVCGDVII